MLNKNLIGILIGLILAVVDIIAFGLTKYIYMHSYMHSKYMHSKYMHLSWLLIPTILYGGQIWLFYYGLKSTSMTELNIVWNIFSSILVTILGIYYFSEKLNNIKTIAVLLGIISIVLFSLNSD